VPNLLQSAFNEFSALLSIQEYILELEKMHCGPRMKEMRKNLTCCRCLCLTSYVKGVPSVPPIQVEAVETEALESLLVLLARSFGFLEHKMVRRIVVGGQGGPAAIQIACKVKTPLRASLARASWSSTESVILQRHEKTGYEHRLVMFRNSPSLSTSK